jgi:hypothetical protein
MAYRHTDTATVRTALKHLANAVSFGLGKGWTVPEQELDYSARLEGPDEAKVYLRIEGDTKGDRVNVSGGFHIGTTAHGNSEYVKPRSGVPADISVALSRGTEVLLREINSRYLPKYLAALAEARTQRDADIAYRNAKHSNLQHLQDLGGDKRKLDFDAERGYLHIGEVYGYIEASETTARLELRCLPLSLAEKIIKLIKDSKD